MPQTPPATIHRGPVVLLGPQRHTPTAAATLAELLDPTDHRPIAAVTAGWEEREAEDDELRAHLDRRVDNLVLHRRALDAFEADPPLLAAVQACHDQLTELQKLYRLQLRYLVRAARALLRRKGTPELLETHRAAAFANLQTLDAHHLAGVREIRDRTARELALPTRASLAPHREELAAVLDGAGALCVAGGHVGVLFNRLWMFDLPSLVPNHLPVVAWSAGAMALSERIVLFHDSPPEGGGHAELFGPGLGWIVGVIPFPHASTRLHLEDPIRVQMLSRRFPDDACLTLDAGSRISSGADPAASTPIGTGSARHLTLDGSVTPEAEPGGDA